MQESDTFNTSTQQVKQLLQEALGYARGLGHSSVGPEHLLMALIENREGIIATTFTRLGLQRIALYRAIERITGRRDRIFLSAELPLAPQTRRAVELAIQEASLLHDDIGPEYLLLGVAGVAVDESEREGVINKLFVALNIAPEQLRRQIFQLIAERDTPPSIPTEARSLVVEGQPSTVCVWCNARSPSYFRHCFNCGLHLNRRQWKFN